MRGAPSYSVNRNGYTKIISVQSLRILGVCPLVPIPVIYMSNEIHRKTDTLFPGNSITIAELEPLTIRSGGSSSNHYATLPP